MSVHIAGRKYKANPIQAAKQLVQLKGLKSKYHFLWNWCISTKKIAKHIAAIIVSIIIFNFVVSIGFEPINVSDVGALPPLI